jgi:hypothetical protein
MNTLALDRGLGLPITCTTAGLVLIWMGMDVGGLRRTARVRRDWVRRMKFGRESRISEDSYLTFYRATALGSGLFLLGLTTLWILAALTGNLEP